MKAIAIRRRDRTFAIEGSALHRDLVANTEAVVGNVGAGVEHGRAAIDGFADVVDDFLDDVAAGVHDGSAFERAFVDERAIKTAAECSRQ